MPVSAVSRYRGGTVEDVTHLAKTMKAILLKHGVAYRVSRFQTGQNVGEWMVVVQYADCRVGGDVAVPTPHRPGRADFPHPVLHERDSLAAA
jgi:hypothetical protein